MNEGNDNMDEQSKIDMVREIRDIIPPRSQKIIFHPCIKTNLQTETKAFSKALIRHRKKSLEEALALLVTIKKTIVAVTKLRKQMSDQKQFVTHPKMLSTWLNQDGWLEDYQDQPQQVMAQNKANLCPQCNRPATIRNADGVYVCRDNYLANADDPFGLKDIHKKMIERDPKRPNESWKDWALRQMAGKAIPGMRNEPLQQKS
jgi:ribosomal protein L37AE/L43A